MFLFDLPADVPVSPVIYSSKIYTSMASVVPEQVHQTNKHASMVFGYWYYAKTVRVSQSVI